MGSRPSSFILTRPGPLRLYSTAELLRLPPPEWLIDNILPAGGLIALFGPPGSGKTFVAIDMALSAAAGGFWQGRTVQAGHVLYVSAEGGPGIGKRVKAWLQHRGVSASQAPVAWLTEAIPVYTDSEDVNRLLDRIEEADIMPSLIVIDTLARCFDGDENQQEDMGRFIAGVDFLRRQYGATVIVVHHTRLDGDRERGSTALWGGTDTMIGLKPTGKDQLQLVSKKQKDAEDFKPIDLRLVKVPGTDSCVIAPSKREEEKAKIGQILAVLTTPMTFDEWHDSIPSIPRTSFYRRVVELRESGEIIKEKGKFRRKGFSK